MILLQVVEAALMLTAGALVIGGYADGLAPRHAVFGIGAALAAAMLLLIAHAQRAPSALYDWRSFCSMAVLAFVCVHLTKVSPAPFFFDSPLSPFYFGVLMLFGASGRLIPWIGVFAIVLVAEGGAAIVKTGAGIADYLPALGPPLGGMLLCGLLPYAIGRSVRRESLVPVAGPAVPALADKVDSLSGPDTAMLQLRPPDSSLMRLADADTRTFAGQGDAPADTAAARVGVEEILASVVYFMRRNFDAYSSLGFIYDPLRQSFILNSVNSKSLHAPKNLCVPMGKGIVGKVGAERRSFLSGDLSLYEGEIGYYAGTEMINSVLASPILTEERELLGVLVVDSKNKRFFTDQHKEIMRRFSALAAALITNARLRIQQQKTARQFQVFYETAQRFTTALSVDEVFAIMLDTAALLANPARTIAVTIDASRGRGLVYRVAGESPDVQAGFEFPLNDGLYSLAAKKRSIVSIGDLPALAQPYYRFLPNEPHQASIRSLIILPIMDDASRCLGLLSLESSAPNFFHGEMQQLLSTFAGNASVAVARALLYHKMEKLATTDGLTGLNNHRFFQDQLDQELERSKRYNRCFSLALLDIDHFKKFNDTYGHQVGDQVLREIALCIRRSVRASDFPARYGGEEFVIILPENDERGAMITAERIRHTVEQHVVCNGSQQLHVTVSLGCATFPTHAADKAGLIDCADKALYYSKEHGRNQAALFRKGM